METMTPRYPNCHVQLTGQDGNAFAIIGRMHTALRRHLKEQGITGSEATAIIDAFDKEAMSGDYSHLLQTCVAWVDAS